MPDLQNQENLYTTELQGLREQNQQAGNSFLLSSNFQQKQQQKQIWNQTANALERKRKQLDKETQLGLSLDISHL